MQILDSLGAPIPKKEFKSPGAMIAQFANRVANGRTRSFVVLEVGEDGSPCMVHLHPDAGPNDVKVLHDRAAEFLVMAEATMQPQQPVLNRGAVQ